MPRVGPAAGAVLAALWLIPLGNAALPEPSPAPLPVHVVRAGETLWGIARQHGTTVEILIRLNELANPDRLQIDQRIVVKAASAWAPVRPGLVWPSRGVLTSRFGFRGRRHHHGIDIAAPVGTPIAAAQDGRVQFVGFQGGYGALVILSHGGGLTTWYGHASKILVTVGQRVLRGQVIAKVGTTGEVTGPNLHFEVRRNNTPLDPLAFLQARR